MMQNAPYIARKDDVQEYQAPPPFTRFARVLLDPEAVPQAGLSIGVYRYLPGQVGPPHHHAVEVEVYYILKGNGTLRLGDRWVPLRQGTMVYIPPGVEHETKNPGDEELEFLGIFAPAVDLGNIKSQWTPCRAGHKTAAGG